MENFDNLLEIRKAIINNKEYEFHWPIQDEGVYSGPLMNLPSHLELWTKYIKKYDVCLSAGAACGMYPKIFSEMFKRVYSFEPYSLSFHCFVLNCQTENVFKLNACLGETTGLVSLDIVSQDNLGMNRVNTNTKGKIPMITIDSLDLDDLDFIQLDVEGFESSILLGAMNTIKKFKPVISCENGNDFIKDLLAPEGYHVRGQSYADTVYSVD
jgi:FkbM family methyltransferase